MYVIGHLPKPEPVEHVELHELRDLFDVEPVIEPDFDTYLAAQVECVQQPYLPFWR